MLRGVIGGLVSGGLLSAAALAVISQAAPPPTGRLLVPDTAGRPVAVVVAEGEGPGAIRPDAGGESGPAPTDAAPERPPVAASPPVVAEAGPPNAAASPSGVAPPASAIPPASPTVAGAPAAAGAPVVAGAPAAAAPPASAVPPAPPTVAGVPAAASAPKAIVPAAPSVAGAPGPGGEAQRVAAASVAPRVAEVAPAPARPDVPAVAAPRPPAADSAPRVAAAPLRLPAVAADAAPGVEAARPRPVRPAAPLPPPAIASLAPLPEPIPEPLPDPPTRAPDPAAQARIAAPVADAPPPGPTRSAGDGPTTATAGGSAVAEPAARAEAAAAGRTSDDAVEGGTPRTGTPATAAVPPTAPAPDASASAGSVEVVPSAPPPPRAPASAATVDVLPSTAPEAEAEAGTGPAGEERAGAVQPGAARGSLLVRPPPLERSAGFVAAVPDPARDPSPGSRPAALPRVASPGLPSAGAPRDDAADTPGVVPVPVPGADPGAAGDTRPAIERHARPFETVGGKPVFAVVLIDTGEPSLDRTALAALPFPVSFVVDPARPEAPLVASIYRGGGQEVAMLASGLPRGATASDLEVTFAAYAELLPESVAVVDPETGGFQGDRPLATLVAPIVAGQGRGLLSWDRGLNAAAQAARRLGLRSGLIERRVDGAGEDRAAIRRQLDRAAFKAAQDGRVIVVGETRPETVAALVEWAAEGRAATVSLAPLSAALVAP